MNPTIFYLACFAFYVLLFLPTTVRVIKSWLCDLKEALKE